MTAIDLRLRRIMDQYHLELNELYLNGLFRARKNNGQEDFDHIDQLWCPAPQLIKKYGRLNDIGQSVFYASSKLLTAVYELRHKVGDRITVLVVRPKEKVAHFKSIAFVGLDRSRAPEVANIRKDEILRHSERFRKEIGDKNHKKFTIIDDFLANLLTSKIEESQDYKYKPTVIMAKTLFTIPGLDALNYPSVATNLGGINFCTTPEQANRNFYGEEAWVMDILGVGAHPDTGEILYATKFVKKSKKINSDGKIEWLKDGDGISDHSVSALVGGISPLDKEPLTLAIPKK